jgi:hypothetical protein
MNTLQVGRVLFVRWEGVPVSRLDAIEIPKLVVSARRSAGKPLIYIASAAANVEAPSEEVRKLMADHMDDMLSSCDTMHLVFEGTGFRHTMQRMAMVSIMLITGKRNRIYVEPSLSEAVRNAPKGVRAEIENAIAAGRRNGFLPTEAESGRS